MICGQMEGFLFVTVYVIERSERAIFAAGKNLTSLYFKNYTIINKGSIIELLKIFICDNFHGYRTLFRA